MSEPPLGVQFDQRGLALARGAIGQLRGGTCKDAGSPQSKKLIVGRNLRIPANSGERRL